MRIHWAALHERLMATENISSQFTLTCTRVPLSVSNNSIFFSSVNLRSLERSLEWFLLNRPKRDYGTEKWRMCVCECMVVCEWLIYLWLHLFSVFIVDVVALHQNQNQIGSITVVLLSSLPHTHTHRLCFSMVVFHFISFPKLKFIYLLFSAHFAFLHRKIITTVTNTINQSINHLIWSARTFLLLLRRLHSMLLLIVCSFVICTHL